MPMQVRGTASIDAVIKYAVKNGARLESASYSAMSPDFDEPYRPEYLVLGARSVPLPTTNDRRLMLDVFKVDQMLTRLGLSNPF